MSMLVYQRVTSIHLSNFPTFTPNFQRKNHRHLLWGITFLGQISHTKRTLTQLFGVLQWFAPADFRITQISRKKMMIQWIEWLPKNICQWCLITSQFVVSAKNKNWGMETQLIRKKKTGCAVGLSSFSASIIHFFCEESPTEGFPPWRIPI